MHPDIVYDYPTWLSGLAIVVATVAASLMAQVIMHAFAPLAFRAQHNDSVAAIFSVIGVTYAVLLAFVAMLTWEGFNKARQATFEEAGAVAELRRLTLVLSDEAADAMRKALEDYVRTVVEVEWPAQTHGAADTSAERDLDELHILLRKDHVAFAMQPNVEGQLLSQLGVLSAARQGRLLATSPTVTPIVWVVLLAGGALMMLFSALLGARSYALHLLMTAALSGSGALVIVLIASLDSPFRSDFRISPAAFTMQSSLPAP